MTGPLKGVRVIEFAGIGPGPFCGMMLADHGAEVIRIERPGKPKTGIQRDLSVDILTRSRRSIVIDLKTPEGVKVARDLIQGADALIEGYRPGVMEKLGLGPDVLLKDNPKLVYGRMTGWGQYGPLAHAAGHDINYIAIAGSLAAFARSDGRPMPPLNMVGDFGGGGMMLAFGMVSAILHARGGGKGQVIDCAITDGTATLMAHTRSLMNMGMWSTQTGNNLLDGGAHFYDAYETADGKYIALGSIEPQFYALFRELVGLDEDADFDRQMDRDSWPLLKQKVEALFRTRTRDEWCKLLEGTDACFGPVLTLDEAPHHPHNVAREAFVKVGDKLQPSPAPRYSETICDTPRVTASPGCDSDEILSELGYSAACIEELRATSTIS